MSTVCNRATIHDLPIELLDDIVELLRYDSATISAISRVCYSWRLSSLRFLFRKVSLSHDDQMLQCIDSVQRTPQITSRYIHKVSFDPVSRKNTYSTNRHARFNPTAVCVGCKQSTGPPKGFIFPACLCSYSYHGPPKISLPIMDSVRVLAWHTPSNPYLSTDAFTKYLSSFPCLVELRLSVRFTNVDQANLFFRLCGRLQILDLQDVGLKDNAPPSGDAVSGVDWSMLRSLRIEDLQRHGDMIVDNVLLASSSPPANLEDLQITDGCSLSPAGFVRLLDVCAPSFKRLSVMETTRLVFWANQRIAPRLFPHLEHVEMGVLPLGGSLDFAQQSLSVYRVFFDAMPDNCAPQLQSVTFVLVSLENEVRYLLGALEHLRLQLEGDSIEEELLRMSPSIKQVVLNINMSEIVMSREVEKVLDDLIAQALFKGSDIRLTINKWNWTCVDDDF